MTYPLPPHQPWPSLELLLPHYERAEIGLCQFSDTHRDWLITVMSLLERSERRAPLILALHDALQQIDSIAEEWPHLPIKKHLEELTCGLLTRPREQRRESLQAFIELFRQKGQPEIYFGIYNGATIATAKFISRQVADPFFVAMKDICHCISSWQKSKLCVNELKNSVLPAAHHFLWESTAPLLNEKSLKERTALILSIDGVARRWLSIEPPVDMVNGDARIPKFIFRDDGFSLESADDEPKHLDRSSPLYPLLHFSGSQPQRERIIKIASRLAETITATIYEDLQCELESPTCYFNYFSRLFCNLNLKKLDVVLDHLVRYLPYEITANKVWAVFQFIDRWKKDEIFSVMKKCEAFAKNSNGGMSLCELLTFLNKFPDNMLRGSQENSLDNVFQLLQSLAILGDNKAKIPELFYPMQVDERLPAIQKLQLLAGQEDLILQCYEKKWSFNALSLVACWVEQFPKRAIPQELLNFYDEWIMPWDQGILCLTASGVWPILEEKASSIWQCIETSKENENEFCSHLYGHFAFKNESFCFFFKRFISNIVESRDLKLLGNVLKTSKRECILAYAQYKAKIATECIFYIINSEEFDAKEKEMASCYLLDHKLLTFLSPMELSASQKILKKIFALRGGSSEPSAFDSWLKELIFEETDLLKKVTFHKKEFFFNLEAIREKALSATLEIDDVEENYAHAVRSLGEFKDLVITLEKEKSHAVYNSYEINLRGACVAFDNHLPKILELSAVIKPPGTPLGGYAYYLYKIIEVIKQAPTTVPEKELFSPQQELLLGLYSLFPLSERDWGYTDQNLHEALANFYYALPLRYRMQRFKNVEDFNRSLAFQVVQTLYQRVLTSGTVMQSLMERVTDCSHPHCCVVVKNLTHRQLGLWHIKEPLQQIGSLKLSPRQTVKKILRSITIQELSAEVMRCCRELKYDPLYSERERVPDIANEQQAVDFIIQTGFVTRAL